jgi:hypothetical protein
MKMMSRPIVSTHTQGEADFVVLLAHYLLFPHHLISRPRAICRSATSHRARASAREWGVQKTRDELRELKIEIAKLGSETAELRAFVIVHSPCHRRVGAGGTVAAW